MKLESRSSEAALRGLREAQLLFHAAQWVPCALYYGGLHDEGPTGPVFPATISFTIRRGVPKWAHHVLWTLGWWKVANVLKIGSASGEVRARAAWTYAQGFLATVVFGLNEDRFNNNVHGVAAAIYMFEHLFLMRLFRHSERYQRMFRISFAAFAGSLVALKVLERKHDLPPEAHATKRRARIASLPAASRAILRLVGFAVMVFENGLFVAFTAGMVKGEL